jgi:hypothetical protein
VTLDAMAAQIVMRARQIERAVHDPGPWTISSKGQHFPARKVIGEDHVTFYAVVDVQHPVLELWAGGRSMMDGNLVAYKLVEGAEGLQQISWEFLVVRPQQVAA